MPHQPPGRFRKLPVVIEAMPFDGTRDSAYQLSKWAQASDPPGRVGINIADASDVYVQTLEGPLTVSPGDWLIRGVQGEFYPCKPSVFEQTYEPAED